MDEAVDDFVFQTLGDLAQAHSEEDAAINGLRDEESSMRYQCDRTDEYLKSCQKQLKKVAETSKHLQMPLPSHALHQCEHLDGYALMLGESNLFSPGPARAVKSFSAMFKKLQDLKAQLNQSLAQVDVRTRLSPSAAEVRQPLEKGLKGFESALAKGAKKKLDRVAPDGEVTRFGSTMEHQKHLLQLRTCQYMRLSFEARSNHEAAATEDLSKMYTALLDFFEQGSAAMRELAPDAERLKAEGKQRKQFYRQKMTEIEDLQTELEIALGEDEQGKKARITGLGLLKKRKGPKKGKRGSAALSADLDQGSDAESADGPVDLPAPAKPAPTRKAPNRAPPSTAAPPPPLPISAPPAKSATLPARTQLKPAPTPRPRSLTPEPRRRAVGPAVSAPPSRAAPPAPSKPAARERLQTVGAANLGHQQQDAEPTARQRCATTAGSAPRPRPKPRVHLQQQDSDGSTIYANASVIRAQRESTMAQLSSHTLDCSEHPVWQTEDAPWEDFAAVLGLSLSGQAPVEIKRVERGSVAAKAGLRFGDLIEAVDGVNVALAKPHMVQLLFMESGGSAAVQVRRP